MADTSKAQKLKLANSRKRFKELQELKKNNNTNKKLDINFENVSIAPTPADSMTSSTHSSSNEQVQGNMSDSFSQLPNYFKNLGYEDKHQAPVMFFDSFLQKDYDQSNSKDLNEENASSNSAKFVSTLAKSTVDDLPPTIVNLPISPKNHNYFEQEDYSLFSQGNMNNYIEVTQQIIHPHQDVKSDDRREVINDGELFILDKYNNSIDTFSVNNAVNLGGYLQENKSEEISEEENFAIKEEITDSSNQAKAEVQHSSVESLRQLSNQMAQLLEPEYTTSSSITDLEKRNLELAALLEHEKMKSEQQNSLINELQMKIEELDTSFEVKENSTFQIRHEMDRLKEELQSHIQTVGMLVAEKTELSSNLSQFELSSKQKSAECEELNARLKVCRTRVADLEREINSVKLEKKQNEKTVQELDDLINRLKQDCNMLREQKEQVIQELLETREKLKNYSEENVILQQQNQEYSSKLSLADIKIQQITNGEQVQITSQLERITQDKFDLEKQVSDLNQMLKAITKEHTESGFQYQQYTQQQSIQLASLSNKIEQLQLENETLAAQERNRIKHISDLERQLQNLQTEQVTFITGKNNEVSLKNDFENTRELCVQLQIEKTAIEENYMKVSNEKEMLLKELEAKNDSLTQLEDLVEQLRGNQPDSVKLLATMESDKIAAARAVQQNKQLKQQMESMEEVFLKLNNDKVELTEQLTKEIGSNRDLLEKLQRTEIHLQRLTDAIEIKDRELSLLQKNTTQLNKQVLKDEQLSDRLRHFEAQDNSSRIIQNQLEEAKQTIMKLTSEINILRYKVEEKAHDRQVTDNSNGTKEEYVKNKDLKPDSHNIVDNSFSWNSYNSEHNDSDSINNRLDKEIAMGHLEEKFKRTMQDIADLTEEKQRLEHLVLQLQGETETIGEYIALYQQQRMVLKQKALEKDHQLKQLATDREQMKTKLEKLNNLIRKLVIENGSVPAELLQQHEMASNQSTNFCEEHGKIHEEISKINENNFPVLNNSKNTETAEEIIALLSDIKSSNLVQPNNNIHHCPWCSGQLITV